MTWIDEAEKLWGADWIAPLSEVLAVNRRSVERWRSEAQPAPEWLGPALQRACILAGSEPRVMGDVMRRLAAGEDVARRIRAEQIALRKVNKLPPALQSRLGNRSGGDG